MFLMPKWLKIKSIPLLIISLLASIILWLVVMGSINPTMTVRYSNLEVSIVGTTELYERNNFSILSETDFSFDVEFSGSRNSILRLRRDDVEIVCDVSKIGTNGTNRVLCQVNTPYDDIFVVDEQNLVAEIEVDKIVEQEIKIRYEILGELPENYMLGKVSLPNEFAVVSGPATELSNIAYGLVSADISDLRDSEVLSLPVTLIGASGEPVDLRYTQQITKNADLDVAVQLIKEVTFTYSLNHGGGLTSDQVDVTVNPPSVTLVGDPDVLMDTDTISLGIIELDGIVESYTAEEQFFLPTNTSCISDRSTVSVEVAVKDIETRTFRIENILATGSVEDFDAEVVTRYINVRMRGNKQVLDSVSTDDFIATVPLDKLPVQAGNHVVAAQVAFDPSLNVDMIDSDYSVTVRLTPVVTEILPRIADSDSDEPVEARTTAVAR